MSFLVEAFANGGYQQRWLIDTGKDSEGMRVIADLHGGDPEDREAKAEFQEIKDKVMADVRLTQHAVKFTP